MSLSELGTIPFLKELAEKMLKYLYRQARLAYFKLVNRKPPLNEAEASHIAHSVIAGGILSAKAYKNLGSKHIFIAGVRENSGENSDRRVFLLEQIGNTYMAIWFSDPLYSMQPKIEIADINRDGIHEIIYADESFGTGAGLRNLTVYLPKDNQVVQLSESYDWQNTTEPVAPRIEIKPDIDRKLSETIERYATKIGFLQEKTISTSSLKYREQSWHLNNNSNKSEFEISLFAGKPEYSNSIRVTVESQDLIWTAYFKGPLIGYIKSQDQHFIAYSPLNIYDWVTALALDGGRLWFATHSSSRLFSFELKGRIGYLRSHALPPGEKLSCMESLELHEGKLLINKKIRISTSNLQEPAAASKTED